MRLFSSNIKEWRQEHIGAPSCGWTGESASSETQGQLVGTMKSLKRTKKKFGRRKVKNAKKSPWGQCFSGPVSNGQASSGFWLGRKIQRFSGTNQKPELAWPFGTGPLKHCPQGLFFAFLTFLRPNFFSSVLDFSPSPLTAPVSPRMVRVGLCRDSAPHNSVPWGGLGGAETGEHFAQIIFSLLDKHVKILF